MQVSKQQQEEKEDLIKENNMHNLTNVIRTKSEMGVFSDYPHFFELRREGSQKPFLFAVRHSENSEFILSKREGDFTMYGMNFMGILKPNFAGTWFELYDYGFDPK